MQNTVLDSNSHFFTYAPETRQICEPLFNASEITGFGYSHYYRDGKTVCLSTLPELVAGMHNRNKVASANSLFKHVKSKNFNIFHNCAYFITDEHNYAGDEYAREYGVSNIIALINQISEDTSESYIFYSTENKNLLSYYFENWGELVKFKHYFKAKSKDLIEKCKHTPFVRSVHDINDKPLKFDREVLHDNLKLSHYRIEHAGRATKVTLRELDCLKGLAQGKSHKDIGKVLGISFRTVEHHQKTLLHKFAVDQKSQLIDIYHRSELRFL